jgi:RNA methyltransferase, TrmH family
MPVRIVQSQHNGRLKELRRALASPRRDGSGLVGIEGRHLLGEAMRAGVKVDCVFAGQDCDSLIDRLGLSPDTELLLFPRQVLTRALATETPQPLAALVTPPEWTWTHVLGGNRKRASLILVLAELQDPGNLGTILRSAEAFGADGVISLPGTVNAWNPKAIRASAGSVFRVPLLSGETRDSIARLRESAVKIYAATARAADPVDLVNLAGPVALLIGNEGNGIPEELAAWVDGTVTIPCPGPVESLNAAVAASVLLYEVSRQRAERSGRRPNHQGGVR